MNELISIRENKGKQVVSARELYLSLGYDSSNYSRWVKSNIIENPYSIEGEDWTPLVTNDEPINQNVNPTKDYAIIIVMAKKIAMMSKTEIGNKIRDYFIECEKKLKQNAPTLPQTYLEALKALVKSEEQKQVLALENESMKPKAEYFDEIVDRGGLTNFRDTAKLLGVSEKAFIFLLIDKKYIYRDQKGTLKPVAKYVGTYFELKEWVRGEKTGTQTLITAKGKEQFLELINSIKL